MFSNYKLYLGVTIVIMGVWSIFQGAFLGGLILSLIGSTLLPKINNSLQSSIPILKKRRIRLFITFFLFVIGIIMASPKWTFLDSESLLEHSIYEEDVYDNTANSKKVIMSVVLEKNSSTKEQDIRNLLNHLYKIKTKETPEDLTISIKLYQSEQHVETGKEQWIAMLHKSYSENEPKISIKNNYYNTQKSKEAKFGLTELQRKEIWNDIVKAQDKASEESEHQFPMNSDHPNYWNGNSFLENTYKEAVSKNMDMSKKLRIKYENEVYSKFDISNEIADSIKYEAMKENWAFPK